jgi:hypothetical protein
MAKLTDGNGAIKEIIWVVASIGTLVCRPLQVYPEFIEGHSCTVVSLFISHKSLPSLTFARLK